MGLSVPGKVLLYILGKTQLFILHVWCTLLFRHDRGSLAFSLIEQSANQKVSTGWKRPWPEAPGLSRIVSRFKSRRKKYPFCVQPYVNLILPQFTACLNLSKLPYTFDADFLLCKNNDDKTYPKGSLWGLNKTYAKHLLLVTAHYTSAVIFPAKSLLQYCWYVFQSRTYTKTSHGCFPSFWSKWPFD